MDAVMGLASAKLAYAAAQRIEAATSDRAALEDMKTWGFSALNAEVAAVDIERRLVETATRAELPAFTIVTESEPVVTGPTAWMGAEIQAGLRWTPTFDFLDAVAAWPEGFQVTHFSYTTGTPPPPGALYDRLMGDSKVRIGLAFPVRLDEPIETSPARAAPASPEVSGPGLGT